MMNNTLPTIPQLISFGLSKNTTGIACATKREGIWYETAVADFKEKIEAFALGLYALGIRKGDRIALHAENSTEWIIVDQAVLRLGAVTVPIYTTQPSDQIQYILENAAARIYIVSTEALYDMLRPSRATITTLEKTIGIRGSYDDEMLAFEDVLSEGRKHREAAPDLLGTLQDAIAPEDLATLVYTSGTTGMPKGVMLTHSNLTSNVLAVQDRFPFDPDAERGGTMLSYLPLSHSLERTATLTYLFIGYPIYFVEDFHEIREDLGTVKPIHMSTVPRLLEKIHAGIQARAKGLSGAQGALMRWAMGVAARYDVEAPPSGLLAQLQHNMADRLVFKKLRNAIFGGNLLALTSGGAALPPMLQTFFNAIGIFCGQGYGLTETSPVATLYKKGAMRIGSAGLAIQGVEIRIADDGEILLRGPNIMKGYYKLPDKTAEVITDEGWFHTGDIGHLDNGHLFITDRKKELFKLSTGKYIAPTPIEIALAACPFVEQAVVVGSEYKFCSALIVLDSAAVRKHVGAGATANLANDDVILDLIDREVQAVNNNLPHWEQVKKFCLLEEPFSIEGGELTPTMKVKRRIVHEKYRAEIDGMYG